MSVFDKIANDSLLFERYASSLLPSQLSDKYRGKYGDSAHYHATLVQVGKSVLKSRDGQPEEFVGLLRQACLDEDSRDTMIRLDGQEAQVVVDAIQLVSVYLLLLDEMMMLYHFSDVRRTSIRG
jgi:hypothetical protein